MLAAHLMEVKDIHIKNMAYHKKNGKYDNQCHTKPTAIWCEISAVTSTSILIADLIYTGYELAWLHQNNINRKIG